MVIRCGVTAVFSFAVVSFCDGAVELAFAFVTADGGDSSFIADN